MTAQVRDLALGMVETNSFATHCGVCDSAMNDADKHSPFATVCKTCADEIQREEQEAYYRSCMRG